jgi:magnesium-transporting ATPase (P-type)
MGFTAAALASVEPPSPLGVRLTQLVRVIVPLVFAGGGVVVVAGVARGRPLLPELALGLSVALAAFPEGLPLMAAVGQSAAAHRLAQRRALVRRVAAVEVLGRVDVACVDKTGTLTEGRLALRALSDFDAEATLPVPLPPRLADVLLAAALASPHPDSDGAMAHATDRAVLRAAEEVGYAAAIRAVRDGEARFSSNRAFHATRSDGAVAVKGAPEVVLPRCDAVRRAGRTAPLGDEERRRLEDAAGRMAERGLRVLAVAIGGTQTSLDDPHGLTAVGLLGISDPLRPSVPDAVRRCRDAGIRLVMLTGDHPATARRIAADAGLPSEPDAVLPAAELASASDDELAERLARVSVIARATPLDKLRIVEALQRAGHVVAMTGDGVNDAPALRLAEVGVAMGIAGTEVARQAADVVLADDDFATLVEALVEGRGFWHNIRRGLGLLLGGNLGELLLVSGASILGRDVPLTIRQVLATNLITDALPALAVVTQPPEHRHLALLAREGTQALDRPLRADIGRRAIATALPSTVAYLARLRGGGAREGRTVAFGSIVATQLAQTLALGRSDGTLTRPVAAATVASAAALGAVLLVPALRGAFELVMPGRAGWIAMAASAVVAPPISRLLASVPGLSGLAVER